MTNLIFPLGINEITVSGLGFTKSAVGGNREETSQETENQNNIETSTVLPQGSPVPEDAEPANPLGGILQLAIWPVMLIAMYFLLFRPQRKRDKSMAEMQKSLQVGDNIITSGGFYGKVVEIGTDAHVIEFGSNRGVRVPVAKSDIVGIKTPVLTPPHE